MSTLTLEEVDHLSLATNLDCEVGDRALEWMHGTVRPRRRTSSQHRMDMPYTVHSLQIQEVCILSYPRVS